MEISPPAGFLSMIKGNTINPDKTAPFRSGSLLFAIYAFLEHKQMRGHATKVVTSWQDTSSLFILPTAESSSWGQLSVTG